MAGYAYAGTETIAAELARKEQLQAELRQAREAYKAAQKLARENERLQQQILATQQRTANLAKPLPTMPEPIHGGRVGLRQAAQEAAQWDRKQREKRAA